MRRIHHKFLLLLSVVFFLSFIEYVSRKHPRGFSFNTIEVTAMLYDRRQNENQDSYGAGNCRNLRQLCSTHIAACLANQKIEGWSLLEYRKENSNFTKKVRVLEIAWLFNGLPNLFKKKICRGYFLTFEATIERHFGFGCICCVIRHVVIDFISKDKQTNKLTFCDHTFCLENHCLGYNKGFRRYQGCYHEVKGNWTHVRKNREFTNSLTEFFRLAPWKSGVTFEFHPWGLILLFIILSSKSTTFILLS